MDERPDRIFHQKGYIEGKHAHEKISGNHQRNASLNHNEILHNYQNG